MSWEMYTTVYNISKIGKNIQACIIMKLNSKLGIHTGGIQLVAQYIIWTDKGTSSFNFKKFAFWHEFLLMFWVSWNILLLNELNNWINIYIESIH
jgi:hypothetical protein